MARNTRTKKTNHGPLSHPGQLRSLADDQSAPQLSAQHKGLMRLEKWVAENRVMALRLSLVRAAEITCLEPCHFSKTFLKHVNMNFSEWRRRYRMAWAVVTIASSTYTIDEVVQLSGYRDRRAFERAVKRITGKTPGCIRSDLDNMEAAYRRVTPAEVEAQEKP
jgi:AraC-like DNA-binding protein